MSFGFICLNKNDSDLLDVRIGLLGIDFYVIGDLLGLFLI